MGFAYGFMRRAVNYGREYWQTYKPDGFWEYVAWALMCISIGAIFYFLLPYSTIVVQLCALAVRFLSFIGRGLAVGFSNFGVLFNSFQGSWLGSQFWAFGAWVVGLGVSLGTSFIGALQTAATFAPWLVGLTVIIPVIILANDEYRERKLTNNANLDNLPPRPNIDERLTKGRYGLKQGIDADLGKIYANFNNYNYLTREKINGLLDDLLTPYVSRAGGRVPIDNLAPPESTEHLFKTAHEITKLLWKIDKFPYNYLLPNAVANARNQQNAGAMVARNPGAPPPAHPAQQQNNVDRNANHRFWGRGYGGAEQNNARPNNPPAGPNQNDDPGGNRRRR